PLIQLYGFIITPDAPLMFCVALVLWSYKKFTNEQANWILGTLLFGASMALLGYAKYHGVLILAFIVLSNLGMLRNWRFWVAVGVASLLFMPHLLWQYNHDWVSFRYHLSARTGDFEWENVWLYIVNFCVTFNPLVVFVFLILLVKDKSKDHLEQALKVITWGFLLFFLWSTTKYHVQPQWLIPLCFPLLYFVVRGCGSRPRLRHYLYKAGYIFVVIIFVGRIVIMVYSGSGSMLEVYNNKHSYTAFADTLCQRPFISSGNYVLSSKLNFYGHNPSYALPNIYARSSHYQYIDMDSHLYGQKVALEISDQAHNSLSEKELADRYFYQSIWRYGIYYDTVDFYIPTRRVSIEYTMPEKVLTQDNLPLELTINNPYDFDIPLTGDGGFKLKALFKIGRFTTYDVPVEIKSTVLPAHGSVKEYTRIIIPTIPTGDYHIGLSLHRYPYSSWFNCPLKAIKVVEVKRR
ncbi:MAG: hypothetical protein RR286_07515, partial [Mucinivorans sp.]